MRAEKKSSINSGCPWFNPPWISCSKLMLLRQVIPSKIICQEQQKWVFVFLFPITPCTELTFYSAGVFRLEDLWMPRYANGPSRYTESTNHISLVFLFPSLPLLSKVSFIIIFNKCRDCITPILATQVASSILNWFYWSYHYIYYTCFHSCWITNLNPPLRDP